MKYLQRLILLLLLCSGIALAGDKHIRPNLTLTPGANDPEVVLPVTAKDICKPGYAGKVRSVPESVKHAVYLAYGLKGNHTGYCNGPEGCEVDHSCSLELGCSNSIKNLWPQSYTGPWNAHMKDKLENRLHALVCAGKVDLPTAQKAISTDWIKAYQEYMK